MPCQFWIECVLCHRQQSPATLRNFKSEERTEKSRFPRIALSEGLVPDTEFSFFWLANIEVTNCHTKTFGVAWPMKRNTTKPFTQIPQFQVRFKMDVDDHHTTLCDPVLGKWSYDGQPHRLEGGSFGRI